MAAVAEDKKKISAWRALGMALGNRKTGFMLLFGVASGLPFALFLGTLFAWLTEAEVDLETMGIFSLIGLAYAFQGCAPWRRAPHDVRLDAVVTEAGVQCFSLRAQRLLEAARG